MQMATHTARDGDVRYLAETGESHAGGFEEDLLVLELTHRLNNELASMAGLVSLTAVRSVNEEVKIALSGVLQRIYEIALIQRSLRVPATKRPIDGAKYLRELCRSISRAKLQYRDIVFLESPLKLNAFDCWRMGMIVSELINNAARHVFRDRGGKIQVEMTNRGTTMECSVADNGCGLTNADEGRGMKIIRSLADLLNGRRLSQRGGQTIALLSFPLASIKQVTSGPGAVGADGRAAQISGRRLRK